VAPTTTTVPATTTTTTTTIALPAAFLHRYGAHDHGNAGAWEAHIQIELRDEFDGKPAFPSFLLSWSGAQSGSTWLLGDKDGKVDVRIGPFAADSLVFSIVSVRVDGYTYRPELNAVPASIKVDGPT
jgi:hypothetical protein